MGKYTDPETIKAINRLSKILKKSYCSFSPQFEEEISTVLKRKTGNDNLGTICSAINSYHRKMKNVTLLSH